MKIIKIGRNPDNDIVIDDSSRTVSGYHAVLKVYKNGKITINDNSTNGTFINGTKANKGIEVVVKKGAEIRFGPHAELNWSLVSYKCFTMLFSKCTRDERWKFHLSVLYCKQYS